MTGSLGITETTQSNEAIQGNHPPIILKKTLTIDATARVKGTVMGVVTGANWSIYTDGLSDGTEVARGILMEDVAIHAATVEALILVHGDVVDANLTGIDAAGRVDLATLGIFCIV